MDETKNLPEKDRMQKYMVGNGIIDTHCHFDLLGSEEVMLEALQNARANNVVAMQTICTKITRFNFIKEFIETHQDVYGSVGIHPNETDNEKVSLEELIELASHPKILSIGETGLDYYYERSNRLVQQESFRTHIAAARITTLPLIVHTRNADDDTVSILREEMSNGAFKGLIHCFTSSKALADSVLDMGFYISLSGIVTFKNAEELRDSIRHIPPERILIETDSPYLAPIPMRGKKNEPAYVLHVARYLADFYKIPFDEFCKITTKNALDLFGF